MTTFKYISLEEYRKPLTQAEFVARVTEVQRRASAGSMAAKTIALWAMENLGATFLRHAEPGKTLHDSGIPGEVLPIVHCGLGVGATEVSDFQPARLRTLIETYSNPQYRLHAYENAGAMLGVYEPDTFTLIAKAMAFLGVLPIMPLHRPVHEKFMAQFDSEIQRLISHGYGRLLYFKSHGLSSAIYSARNARCFHYGACVQGIAFAYSMVNHEDMDRVWQAGEAMLEAVEGAFFREGLIYALEFWEWFAPGTLDKFAPGTAFAGSLIASAQRQIAAARADNYLPPFTLTTHGDSDQALTS